MGETQVPEITINMLEENLDQKKLNELIIQLVGVLSRVKEKGLYLRIISGLSYSVYESFNHKIPFLLNNNSLLNKFTKTPYKTAHQVFYSTH